MQIDAGSPSYGLRSGLCTLIGLSPHLLFLLFLLLAGKQVSLTFLIIASIGAKLLGEYLFWHLWAQDVGELSKGKRWTLNYEMISHPNVWVSLCMICSDCMADAMLIIFALDASLPPIMAFFILLFCQGLASPIQGLYSDLRSQKNSMLFACIATMCCLIAMQQVPSVWLGFLLGLKGIVGNITTIARAVIAENLIYQVKTNY